MNKITMLGTGNATVTQCYNTCFALQTDTTLLLVDGGGGNGVLAQLKRAGIAIADIHHLFVTHAHTDHILGVIWLIRMGTQINSIYGIKSSEKVKNNPISYNTTTIILVCGLFFVFLKLEL